MTTPAQLLRVAGALSSAVSGKSRPSGPRAAAFLTRQAIEAALEQLWSHQSPALARCSVRAQLICLSAAGLEPELVRLVRHAWAALSAACHHHPYEVGPTTQELDQWIRAADRLIESVASRT